MTEKPKYQEVPIGQPVATLYEAALIIQARLTEEAKQRQKLKLGEATMKSSTRTWWTRWATAILG